MGNDFSTFAAGLRAALRQAPKVVLVGEMRDRETVEIGLSAAETGHLVLSTLHTIDAGQTINRILGMFEPEEQEQVRIRLADTLRWIISQRLAPRVGGGRYALIEIMGANLRTKDTIIHGESEGKSFYEIIEANHTFGWRTFRPGLPGGLRTKHHHRGNARCTIQQARRRLPRHRCHQKSPRRRPRHFGPQDESGAGKIQRRAVLSHHLQIEVSHGRI